MTDSLHEDTDMRATSHELREYAMLIVVCAAALAFFRMSLLPPWFLGQNDASRWNTIRALVDDGTYAIGRRERLPTRRYSDSGNVTERGWRTLDKVLHPENQHFYSSKPLLLPTLVAGEYWLLKNVLGWTIVQDTRAVVFVILLTVNLLPFVLSLWALFLLICRCTKNAWTRLFVLTSAGFATMAVAFQTTLNNHTVAVWSFTFALFFFLQIWQDRKREWWRFVLAGLFTGWLSCNEIPATFMLPVFGVLLLRRDSLRALTVFLPAALLPIAAQLILSYAIYGTVMPMYTLKGTEWYLYEGSYWLNPRGVDVIGPSVAYVFNMTVGHHGFFSLTPIFFLSLYGAYLMRKKNGRGGTEAGALHGSTALTTGATPLPTITLLSTFFLFVLYATISTGYSGNSTALRWFIWITPLWLLLMIPAVEKLSMTLSGRLVAWTFFAPSAFAVFYNFVNPWNHPWIYNVLSLGP